MAIRIAEFFSGSVRVLVLKDQSRTVLSALIARGVPLFDVEHVASEQYQLTLSLAHVKELVRAVRLASAKVQFINKWGLPFVLWRARRRKAFIGGALFFVLALYTLSGFIWHVEIEGTDQPEVIQAALQKLHVYPGGLLYRVVDQDALQLALLDALPDLSWVGVRMHGTSIYIRVISRIQGAKVQPTTPQDIVAKVPGVVAIVLADNGQAVVKPGQFVTPGTILISGVLEDGKSVHASGIVRGIVWYRSDVTLSQKTTVDLLSGEHVSHDYLMLGKFALQIWGFSHPPYTHEEVQSIDVPLKLWDLTLPLVLRKETVYEAIPHTVALTESALTARGLQFAATDVLAKCKGEGKVLRQNILQRKLEHGKLYMTVWTEVLQDIGINQAISPQKPETGKKITG
ncbi:sporulation protein YqfD [Sulfoacidibacillus thermotolerans]|uniref:Sporulation protein YqfD n=1 Tax=Sulfoacidibacillus thermotolerans TaxID=1765684 RepID=A0A2U3D6E5_SULT2|nr:sporulation protein YqfD [Sulfoacidibacillus thermotolerans]PWI56845.1 hypothetical protein BM613_11430 [Sulfoacidibacillus thermotolerans]